MKKQKLFSEYTHGVIDTKVIHDKNISKSSKVIYSLLQSKIGGYNYIEFTQKQVKDCLNIGIATIKRGFAELKKLGLVTKSKEAKKAYSVKKASTIKGNRFGWVEYSILQDSDLTLNEKLMYIFYATVADYKTGISNYARDKVTRCLAIGADTYVNTINAMEEHGIIATDKGYGSKDNKYSDASTPNTYITKRVKIFRLNELRLATIKKNVDPFVLVKTGLADVKRNEYAEVEKKVSAQNKKVSYQNEKVSSQDREQTTKQLNNNKEGNIIISDSIITKFNWFWDVEPRGNKASSLKAFATLEVKYHDELMAQLEENPRGYYGYIIKQLKKDIAERSVIAEAKPKRVKKVRKNATHRL